MAYLKVRAMCSGAALVAVASALVGAQATPAIGSRSPPETAQKQGAEPGWKDADGQTAHARPPGYLRRDLLPDSLALLPPPPDDGSAAFARDQEAHRSEASLRGSARWTRASSDALLSFP